MSKNTNPEIILNGLLIENATGRYTAFFEEFPEVIAEGDNEEDAKKNLTEAFMMVAQFKIKQLMKRAQAQTKIIVENGHKPAKHFHQPFGQLQAR